MENYISTVLNKIKDGKVKADIQAELEDHYNERVEYYTRIGYDKETAEAKANAHFGEDAEIVGEQIALVNQKHKSFSTFLSVANIVIFFIPYTFGFVVFLLSGNYFFTSYFPFFVSLGVTLFCFIEILISLISRAWFLSCISALNFILLGFFYRGYSPFVFCIYKLLKGQLNSLVDLIYHFDWACTNKMMNISFIAFYVLCIALSIFSMILIIRFKKCKYSKKNLKQEKGLKISLISLIALSLVCIGIVSVYSYDKDYSDWKSLDGVYVVESDKMCHPVIISDYTRNYLYLQWGSDFWEDFQEAHAYHDSAFISYDLHREEITEQYDEDVEIYYTNSELLGEFQPTKKYVCIIPVYRSSADFSDYNWVETSEEYVFESERDSSHTKYEIKILPKEDSIGN